MPFNIMTQQFSCTDFSIIVIISFIQYIAYLQSFSVITTGYLTVQRALACSPAFKVQQIKQEQNILRVIKGTP